MLDAQRPVMPRFIRMNGGAYHLRPVRPCQCQHAVCGVEGPTEHEEQAEEQRHAFPRERSSESPLLFVEPHYDPEDHRIILYHLSKNVAGDCPRSNSSTKDRLDQGPTRVQTNLPVDDMRQWRGWSSVTNACAGPTERGRADAGVEPSVTSTVGTVMVFVVQTHVLMLPLMRAHAPCPLELAPGTASA